MREIIEKIRNLFTRRCDEMKRNNDEPLYGNDECSEEMQVCVACGGELVRVREGVPPIYACITCGKRAP